MSKKFKKQPNARDCFICGMQNDKGLKARFYETDEKEVVVYFTPGDEYQGYPGRLHGGVAASVLDEAIGRASFLISPSIWGVTTDLKVKYRKPLPLNVELKAVCRITKDHRMMYEGTGEIYTPDGKVAISAEGRYMKLDVDKITEADFKDGSEHWKVYPDEE
jgi:uncharacterized protein (TIGR00369 family)